MGVAKRLRVLVVDDQQAVRDVVGDMAQFAGHDVVGRASDGIEAVAEASKRFGGDLDNRFAILVAQFVGSIQSLAHLRGDIAAYGLESRADPRCGNSSVST